MMNEAKHDRLVWIDLEMTGLDPKRHTIVEVAAIITDHQLNILGSGLDLVCHATAEQLAEMDDFVTKMHTSSGLLEQIKSSTISIAEAEDAVLALLEEHCHSQHPPLLAGNSIASDRSFIKEYMPRLDQALHYRMIDVSTMKELARRWYPAVYQQQPAKNMDHRALVDITESIRELEFYRRAMFLPQPGLTGEEVAAVAAATTADFAPLLAKD